MTLLGLVVVLIVVGVLLYLVHAVIPMDPRIRVILDVVVILAVLLYVGQQLGACDAPGPLDRPMHWRR